MESLEKLLQLLIKLSHDARQEAVREFQRCFVNHQNSLERSVGKDAYELLCDLAWDLNYFVADPVVRMEDAAYYGPDRLEKDIKATLRQLSELGVAVPDGR
jgi:hypothetical protein